MKIFVGNLSFSATEDSVRSLFETHGSVDRVNIMTDRETGRSRGFGFVEMANDNEAQRAISALNGREAAGRALTVNEARPKVNREFGGGFRQQNGGNRRTQPRW
jgi:cold-inducible RNA-binding protein